MIFLSLKYNIDIILNKLAILVIASCLVYWILFFYIDLFYLFFQNLFLNFTFLTIISNILPFKTFTFYFNDLFYNSFNLKFDSIFISGKEAKFLTILSNKWASFNFMLRENGQPCASYSFNRYDGFTQFKRLNYKGSLTCPILPDLKAYFMRDRTYPFIYDYRALAHPRNQENMLPSKYWGTMHAFKPNKFYRGLEFHFSIGNHALNPVMDKTAYIFGGNADIVISKKKIIHH